MQEVVNRADDQVGIEVHLHMGVDQFNTFSQNGAKRSPAQDVIDLVKEDKQGKTGDQLPPGKFLLHLFFWKPQDDYTAEQKWRRWAPPSESYLYILV